MTTATAAKGIVDLQTVVGWIPREQNGSDKQQVQQAQQQLLCSGNMWQRTKVKSCLLALNSDEQTQCRTACLIDIRSNPDPFCRNLSAKQTHFVLAD